jgi:hypothetical protein
MQMHNTHSHSNQILSNKYLVCTVVVFPSGGGGADVVVPSGAGFSALPAG